MLPELFYSRGVCCYQSFCTDVGYAATRDPEEQGPAAAAAPLLGRSLQRAQDRLRSVFASASACERVRVTQETPHHPTMCRMQKEGVEGGCGTRRVWWKRVWKEECGSKSVEPSNSAGAEAGQKAFSMLLPEGGERRSSVGLRGREPEGPGDVGVRGKRECGTEREWAASRVEAEDAAPGVQRLCRLRP